ncbi:MAG: stage III sporulation protein J, partial [Lachnospiraceae bacterium]|nr:stage III sporulation protein J [Lachnospiraceae bacterium]
QGIDPAKLQAAAKTSTKNIAPAKRPERKDEENADDVRKSTEYYNKNAKPGSLAAKANMVKQYNEKK